MELGMIGLGKMGANMAQRLVRGGHRVVGFDPKPEARRLVEEFGAESADSLQAMAAKLAAPRAVWMMVPAGDITGSTVERHDTIGGACSKESNALRYGFHTMAQHACVENFLHEMARHGLDARDLQSNINWFMNVPVDPDGTLGIVDGISAPGLWIEVRAEADVLVVVSNCPQVNNPCNGFDPTPIRIVVSEPAG